MDWGQRFTQIRTNEEDSLPKEGALVLICRRTSKEKYPVCYTTENYIPKKEDFKLIKSYRYL